MTIILSLIAIWLVCGLGALLWFHRWRAGSGYSKTWHIVADYLIVVALGPISFIVMAKRDVIGKLWAGGRS